MLAQSEHAKEALVRAGLTWRKDFLVRTYQVKRNGHFVGYENSSIVLLNLEKAVALTEKIRAEGLSVVQFVRAARTLMYVYDNGKGTFDVHEERDDHE